MAYDPGNPFAKILRRELPCFKLFEDEHTLAFLDIMPQADGHTLVIPKQPAETLFELSEAATLACMRVVHRLAPVLYKAMDSAGIQIMQANGAAAGQTVPHVHFHIIPRYENQPLRLHAAKMEDAEMLRRIARRIETELNGGLA